MDDPILRWLKYFFLAFAIYITIYLAGIWYPDN